MPNQTFAYQLQSRLESDSFTNWICEVLINRHISAKIVIGTDKKLFLCAANAYTDTCTRTNNKKTGLLVKRYGDASKTNTYRWQQQYEF